CHDLRDTRQAAPLKQLRNEDALVHEQRVVGGGVGVGVRAAVVDLDLAELPVRARVLGDLAGDDRIGGGGDRAGRADRGVCRGGRARHRNGEGRVLGGGGLCGAVGGGCGELVRDA